MIAFWAGAEGKAVVGIGSTVHLDFFIGGVSETNLALAAILTMSGARESVGLEELAVSSGGAGFALANAAAPG
jgi:hypothetical protein